MGDCLNLAQPDDPDTKELVDYVSECCRTHCGAPIYHNKHTQHNRVGSCKYYFLTLRGLNFLTTITNIMGWIVTAVISLVRVQDNSFTHFLVVMVAAVLVYLYQYIHAVVLCRQRCIEFEQSSEPRRCRWLWYFWDVAYCFGMASVSLLCMVLYLMGNFQ